MKCILCTQMVYFRQELLMILGWEILLGLPKKSDTSDNVLKKLLKQSKLIGITVLIQKP